MLRLAPGSRIFMAVKPVDMRRSFDGLCPKITEALGGDPLSGDVFLFRDKWAGRIKAIVWDRTGLPI
jgi:transposase